MGVSWREWIFVNEETGQKEAGHEIHEPDHCRSLGGTLSERSPAIFAIYPDYDELSFSVVAFPQPVMPCVIYRLPAIQTSDLAPLVRQQSSERPLLRWYLRRPTRCVQ